MLLTEIYQDATLIEEGLVKRAIAAAAIALASIAPNSHVDQSLPSAQTPPTPVAQTQARTGVNVKQSADHMIRVAAAKYKVDPKVVRDIVSTALKYQDPVFPRAEHILAVIGVESSFNPKAQSQLKSDPAKGLMQVRPGVWDLPQGSLDTIDGQIKHGADILRQYYKKLGNKDAALQAYNVGLTNYRKSLKDPTRGNPRYAPKVNAELGRYSSN